MDEERVLINRETHPHANAGAADDRGGKSTLYVLK
jgi:hypothetical protein